MGVDNRTPGNAVPSPERASARAAELTPDRAREMVERFPWVSTNPAFFLGRTYLSLMLLLLRLVNIRSQCRRVFLE